MLLSLVLCLFALALPLWSQINPGAPVTPPTPEPQVNPATPNPQVNLPPAAPQQNAPTIERIEFQGNRRIRTETLQARIFTRTGDPYNEDALRRDFQALWNTQYFEDVRLEAQDSPTNPNAKIVIFYVVERPIIRRIEYHRNKLHEDLEAGIRNLYQSAGYFKVVVKDPILMTVDVNREGLGPLPIIGHQHGKATNLTIPIEEGEQYHMGRLVIRSADPEKGLSLKREYLESVFPLHQGDLFDISKIRKAIENYNKLYGVYGYIDFTRVPLPDVHKDTKIINLTLDFDEQKQYFVRRIDFSGNTTTRDKVIRRELMLSEGDIFNNNAWELSILRLNQLDYFYKIKPDNADIKRNTKQGTVDILLKLKEKGKQSISLTGGVSGLAGSFIGLSYQTNNFLGLGETLSLSGQVGDIQKSALFGFTEPYLLDRPIATGFTVSYTSFKFNQSQQESILFGQKIQINPSIEQNYAQNTLGGTVFASYPLRKFSFARLGLTYGYSRTDITAFSTASTDLFEVLDFQSLAGASALT